MTTYSYSKHKPKKKFDKDPYPKKKYDFDKDPYPKKKYDFDKDPYPKKKYDFDKDPYPKKKYFYDKDPYPKKKYDYDKDFYPKKKYDYGKEDFDVKVGIYDAHSDSLITNIKDGDYVPYSALRHKKLTIAAYVHDYKPYDYKKVESMYLDYDHGYITRKENYEPYSLLGDKYGDYYGRKGLIDKGHHTMSFDFYSKDDLKGYYLGNETVKFTVYDDYYYSY